MTTRSVGAHRVRTAHARAYTDEVMRRARGDTLSGGPGAAYLRPREVEDGVLMRPPAHHGVGVALLVHVVRVRHVPLRDIDSRVTSLHFHTCASLPVV